MRTLILMEMVFEGRGGDGGGYRCGLICVYDHGFTYERGCIS